MEGTASCWVRTGIDSGRHYGCALQNAPITAHPSAQPILFYTPGATGHKHSSAPSREPGSSPDKTGDAACIRPMKDHHIRACSPLEAALWEFRHQEKQWLAEKSALRRDAETERKRNRKMQQRLDKLQVHLFSRFIMTVAKLHDRCSMQSCVMLSAQHRLSASLCCYGPFCITKGCSTSESKVQTQ